MNSVYQKLFEPVMVGRLKLKNRLVMPAMCTDFGDKDGYVTQRLLHHYIERAKGGAGLIIIEVTSVAPGGRAQLNQLRIDDDRFISGLSKLAEGIKNGGAKCFIQLHHAGRVAPPAFNDGLQPVAPSAIAGRGGAIPRELTIAEIEGVVESFAQAARRAREAGFDGVELQYAHGYLIAEFLSPLTNKRRDKYGGDLISRARIAVDIIHRIRQVVGSDYPLGVRFTGDEEIKGGLRLNETKRIAVMFEEAGVNVLNVSTGYKASHEEGFFNCANATSGAPMTRPHGCFIPLAEGVKQAVKIPVIAMGRLDDADIALDVIKKGKADLIAIARGHLVDPYFVTKLQENRLDEIRRCIACNRCFETLYREADLRCTVNPELGKDEEYRIKPAKQVKQVLVVGGGPGGMEAARVAALRGHKVILMEKNSELGGNLISAAGVSYKSEISNLTEYLKKAIQKAGVDVKLNIEATVENIRIMKPDVVILATGSEPVMPNIPGIKNSNVSTAVAVLEGKVNTGHKVVVAGGGEVGCEVAVYLAEKGKQVTIVEMRDTDWSDTDGLALGMDGEMRKWFFGELLPGLPIEVIGKVMFQEVTKKGLIVKDREGGSQLVQGDSIVFAAGLIALNGLKEKLTGIVPEVYEVGDCIKARKIMDATAEGARVARLI